MGCGSGDFVLKLKDRFTEIYGIDTSSSRIEKAQAAFDEINTDNKIGFSVCDIDQKFDFSDDMFDVVTLLTVLEYIFNLYFVIKEIC